MTPQQKQEFETLLRSIELESWEDRTTRAICVLCRIVLEMIEPLPEIQVHADDPLPSAEEMRGILTHDDEKDVGARSSPRRAFGGGDIASAKESIPTGARTGDDR